MPLDYGEEWLDSREGTFADNIPRRSEYIKATDVMEKIYASTQQSKNPLTGTSHDEIIMIIMNIFIFHLRSHDSYQDILTTFNFVQMNQYHYL